MVVVAARQGLKPTPHLPNPCNERHLRQTSQLAKRPNSPGSECFPLFRFEFQHRERKRGQDVGLVASGNDRDSRKAACRYHRGINIAGRGGAGFKSRSLSGSPQRHGNLLWRSEEPFAGSNVQDERGTGNTIRRRCQHLDPGREPLRTLHQDVKSRIFLSSHS